MGELVVFVNIDFTEFVIIFDYKTFFFFKTNSFWFSWVEFCSYNSIDWIIPSSQNFELCEKTCKPKLQSIYSSFENLSLSTSSFIYDFSWFLNLEAYCTRKSITIFLYNEL